MSEGFSINIDEALDLAQKEFGQEILSSALLGSHARGDQYAGSDLDLLFLTSEEEKISRFFYYGDFLVEVIRLGEKTVELILENPESDIKLVRMLSEGKVISDESGKLTDIINKSKELRDRPRKTEGSNARSKEAYQAEGLHLLKKLASRIGDPPSANLISGLLAQKSIESFYYYRGLYPVSIQNIFEDLEVHDSRFAALLRNFLESELDERLSIGVDLVERAFHGQKPVNRFTKE